jgi:hypothetical protein
MMTPVLEQLERRIDDAKAMGAQAPVARILESVVELIREHLAKEPDSHRPEGRPLSTSEVAEIEGVSRRTVNNRCALGEYPGAYRNNGERGHWRIPSSAIEARKSAVGHAASQNHGVPLSPHRRDG